MIAEWWKWVVILILEGERDFVINFVRGRVEL